MLSRLKKNGLVQGERGTWSITKKGLERLASALPSVRKRGKVNSRTVSKSMIVMFDVPERMRRKRDWLRLELVCLGFEMLQKSVWFGPAPLPPEFIQSLNQMKLLSYLKFFEAREADIV